MKIWIKQIYRRAKDLNLEYADAENNEDLKKYGFQVTDDVLRRVEKQLQAVLRINRDAYHLLSQSGPSLFVEPYNWMIGSMPTQEYKQWPPADYMYKILKARTAEELGEIRENGYSGAEIPPDLTRIDE